MREDNLYWVKNINTNGCVHILVYINSLFGSVVVVVAFQITFHAEMYTNNVFLFFFKLFLTSAHQNDPNHTKHIKF